MSKSEQHEHGYAKDKEALVKRLHRIEVRGIERMVEDDRYCMNILTQIAAVNTALEALALKLLNEHVGRCVAPALTSGDKADAGNFETEELLEGASSVSPGRADRDSPSAGDQRHGARRWRSNACSGLARPG